jgi:hypothetical protein
MPKKRKYGRRKNMPKTKLAKGVRVRSVATVRKTEENVRVTKQLSRTLTKSRAASAQRKLNAEIKRINRESKKKK